MIHFLMLSALARAIFIFASNKVTLNPDFTGLFKDLQGGSTISSTPVSRRI